MILRRFAQSLREQNWTTITIEFVLLVLGVFLGIQAANWNAQRGEDARAQAYVARIRSNLEADLQSIERRIVFWGLVIDHGNDAIRYAETGELVDGSAWKTVRAFYQASQVWQWGATNPTYQEMRSAGELGLIRDARLRDALSEYYASSVTGTDYLFAFQPEYRKLVRGLTPSVVANHIWAKCCEQPHPAEQTLFDCESPISEAEAQAVLAGYLAEPKLLPELRFWVANQGVAREVIANYPPVIRDMLALSQENAAP